MNAYFQDKLAHSMSYAEYRHMLDSLMAERKTTGSNQSEEMVHYAEVNLQRMRRLDKTTVLQPELADLLAGLKRRYIWLVITEGWCGDAAQNIPLLHLMAEASGGHIQLRLVLRDEHPDLMDRYLTGTSRSIPKLICLDADTLEEAGVWGPRPATAHAMVVEAMAAGVDHHIFAEDVHRWYAQDKTRSAQEEFITLIRQCESPALHATR
jgi:Thioredoxin